jgi:hypothetical protein
MTDDNEKTAEELGHEPIAVSARSITISIVVLMGVVVASLLVIGVLMFGLSRIWDGWATVNAPPGPKEPEDLRAAFRTLRSTENKMLSEYGWVNEQAGIARIPIARAMEMEAARLGTMLPTNQQENRNERPENNP